MPISARRWSVVPGALWALAVIPSAAGSSSWLPYKATRVTPSFVSFAAGCVKQQSWPSAWPTTGTGSSSSRVPATSRLALTCSLDDLRAVQREAGGVVGDVSYDEGGEACRLLVAPVSLVRLLLLYMLTYGFIRSNSSLNAIATSHMSGKSDQFSMYRSHRSFSRICII